MATHGAFLRGINLGPRRRVANATLVSCLTGLGLRDVVAYRGSGNVLFTADDRSDDELAALIETGLERTLGLAVDVFVRSAEELRAVAAARPFPDARVRASGGKLQVAFLGGEPSGEPRERALAHATADDLLAFGERELYWLPGGRMADSGLDLRGLERLLGPWTMRTKATVEQAATRYLAPLE